MDSIGRCGWPVARSYAGVVLTLALFNCKAHGRPHRFLALAGIVRATVLPHCTLHKVGLEGARVLRSGQSRPQWRALQDV